MQERGGRRRGTARDILSEMYKDQPAMRPIIEDREEPIRKGVKIAEEGQRLFVEIGGGGPVLDVGEALRGRDLIGKGGQVLTPGELWNRWFWTAIQLSPVIIGAIRNVPVRGIGGIGWRGDKAWRDQVGAVLRGGDVAPRDLRVTPTRQEAIDLLDAAGCRIDRIEGPHLPPNPHQFPHINFTTPHGQKGTIPITGFLR